MASMVTMDTVVGQKAIDRIEEGRAVQHDRRRGGVSNAITVRRGGHNLLTLVRAWLHVSCISVFSHGAHTLIPCPCLQVTLFTGRAVVAEMLLPMSSQLCSHEEGESA